MTRGILLSVIAICLWTNLFPQTAGPGNGIPDQGRRTEPIEEEPNWAFAGQPFAGARSFYRRFEK